MKNKSIGLLAALLCAGCILASFIFAGCTGTVAPKQVTATQASFDAVPDARGQYQNSGILGFTNHMVILTPTARDRYNALVKKWGKNFIPAITNQDAGLTLMGTNRWLMDKDHLDKWATMTAWQVNPPPTVKAP
jgi:hypothetical protein